jgi:ADP-ribosylglycohydrolase
MTYRNKKVELSKSQQNSIYGFIIGDCMGVPYEFTKSNHLTKLKAIGNGTHNQPAGTWSDDTAFLLATLDSQIDSLQSVIQNFQMVIYGKYTTDNYLFDVGHATSQALWGNPIAVEIQQGNGALMRILPIAFIEGITFEERFALTKSLAEITHKSDLSTLCCLLYVEVFRNCLNNNFHCVNNAKHLSQKLNETIVINRLTNFQLTKINNKGWVLGSLELVLNICDLAESFQDGIIKVINLGGDTDTHAALAGAILAIKFNDWKKHLPNVRNLQIAKKIIDN